MPGRASTFNSGGLDTSITLRDISPTIESAAIAFSSLGFPLCYSCLIYIVYAARGDIVCDDDVAEKLVIASDCILCGLKRSSGLDILCGEYLNLLLLLYKPIDPVISDESIAAALSIDNLCEVSYAAFTRRPASGFLVHYPIY
jgi:hypothetical protein